MVGAAALGEGDERTRIRGLVPLSSFRVVIAPFEKASPSSPAGGDAPPPLPGEKFFPGTAVPLCPAEAHEKGGDNMT